MREAGPQGTRVRAMASCAHAFTLLELLVTISIIAILVALVLPMLSHTIGASRGFKCQQTLRNIAYDFQIFADDNLHGYRGDSPGNQSTFTLENFVESQYNVAEFWAWPGETRHDLPDAAGNDPMRCPDVKGEVTLRANLPCYAGAVSPNQNVSYGFNIRLRVAERIAPAGQIPVTLTNEITGLTNVPLVWDVDGELAAARNQRPLFTGPSLDSPALFANDRYWFPALRHNGAGNFAFTDGHVSSSMQPLNEPTWEWDYSPHR